MNISLVDQFNAGLNLINSLEYKVDNLSIYLEYEGSIFSVFCNSDKKIVSEIDIRKEEVTSLPCLNENIKAMVKSNTPYLGEYIRKGVTFPVPLDDMSQIVGPEFFVSKINYEDFLNSTVIKNNLKGTNATIVKCDEKIDFSLCVGRDIIEAVTTLMVLEKCAKAYSLAHYLGEPKIVPMEFCHKMKKIYDEKYSNNLINGFTHNEKKAMSEVEFSLRKEIVKYGNKLVETRLVERSWGNISARLNEEEMLVTPSGIEYKDLLPSDIVKVNINTLEYEGKLKPTSEKTLHSMIYKNRKDVKAIVHTHSDFLSAFSCAWKDMKILDKYKDKLGDEIKCSKYGMSTTEELAINTSNALFDNTGTIISNHGMMSVGISVEDAFNNALLLENNAKEIITLKEEKMISVNSHSSIRIEGKDLVIYVDPFHIKDELHDADLVLTTHDHYDHNSPEDIEKVRNENTVVLQLKPGDTYELKGAKVKAYPAYNVVKKFHPKENNWVGYFIIVDNKNIYVTGDSDAEIDIIEPIDVLLIPVGGTYTFDINEAARYTNMLMPKKVIPTHYGDIVGDITCGEKFGELVDEKIQVELKIK